MTKKILLIILIFIGALGILLCFLAGWALLKGPHGTEIILINNSGEKRCDIRISYTKGEEPGLKVVKELDNQNSHIVRVDNGVELNFHKIWFSDSSGMVYTHELNFYVPFELDAQLQIKFIPKGNISIQEEMWLLKLGRWKY